MTLTIKQKLYKTKRVKFLEEKLDVACWIYNHCIEVQKTYYKLFKKHLSKARLQAHIAKLKKKYPQWSTLNSQAIQNIVERIEFGYQKFFKHENRRPPTFRSSSKYKSLTYKQTGWKLNRNRLTIQGIVYRFALSRRLGDVRRLVVKKDSVGDWYVSFTCEVNEEYVGRIKTGKTAGLDFGLKVFLTSDSGETYKSPLFYKQGSVSIRKASANLSRRKKGSVNRRRARVNLAKVHRKVTNKRLDHHFKLARELALNYDAIFIEDLNINGMKRLWGKKVSDLGFSQFVSILKWMCKKLKSTLVSIDRWFPSTKTCSKCQFVNHELTLKDRQWKCPKCKVVHNRDINAAINIKRVGASTLSGDGVRPTLVGIHC